MPSRSDHPDTSYWQKKVSRIEAITDIKRFTVNAWNGKTWNSKTYLIELYQHLAHCPKRHSSSQALRSLPFCTDDF